MKKRSKFALSTTHIILGSFLLAILVGSALLSLPISAADGRSVPYLDALFTATTATCVTGLVTLPTYAAWSTFGQVVILVLIQVGGLGIITAMAGFSLLLHRKMGVGDRILLQDSFNLTSLSGISQFLRRVLLGTFAVEGVGALLCMTVFVPRFGARGIWISVFHSISAFCNAGIDIIGPDSLCEFALHPVINAVTCALILLGGLGFIVWWDVLRVMRELGKRRFRCFRSLTLHSKIVLSATAILIFGGALLFLLFEWSNPQTMAGKTIWEKLELSIFQSVTTRTAGFATLPQRALTDSSSFLSLILMFIGGSPVGTAGGVKTVTLAVLAAAALSSIRGRNETVLFGRTVSRATVGRAIGVVGMSFGIMLLSTLLLSFVTSYASAMDILYETVSATATVGLSRDLTPALSSAGKLIVTATMYLGRVGPISLAIAFGLRRESKNLIVNPTEEVSVG